MQKACNASEGLASEGLGVTISSFTKGDEIHKASVLLSSVQHIRNTDTLVHCVSVPCGVLCFLNRNSPLQHVVHCSRFWKTLVIRSHQCGDAIEGLYCSAGYEDICIFCATSSDLVQSL